MKKSILVVILICYFLPLFAQEEKFDNGETYSSKRKKLSTRLALATKSHSNQLAYCLVEYHNERFGATLVGLGSMVLSGTSIILSGKQNSSFATYIDPKTHVTTYKNSYPNFFESPAGYVAIAGGIAGLVSMIIFIDAEKWISQRNIVFTNNGLAYRF
ncbi:MAG: hypothetical protein M1292_09910 [Bacteroidetes bacterium]|nr:hypothetical protein [Bacteroidota bacterium]